MSIETLTNEELTNRIDILRSKEREVVLKFLLYLGEFEKRRLYLGLGYASLYDFCTRKLGYSDGAAYRRIESARCLRLHPELAENFLKGEVSICTISTASRAIKEEKAEIKDIIGKSKSEVESLVAPLIPVSKPREVIKEIKVTPLVTSKDISIFPPPVEVKDPVPESRYEIKFSVDKETYEKIQSVKAKLSNKLGSNLSIESIFNELLNDFVAEPKPKERTKINDNSRYIPISVKREVLGRDNHQCSYVSPDGVKCTAKHYLQFDHVRPFAIGGKSNSENIRLLCSAHNRARIAETFPEFILQQ